jgi:hypothetical protein
LHRHAVDNGSVGLGVDRRGFVPGHVESLEDLVEGAPDLRDTRSRDVEIGLLVSDRLGKRLDSAALIGDLAFDVCELVERAQRPEK